MKKTSLTNKLTKDKEVSRTNLLIYYNDFTCKKVTPIFNKIQRKSIINFLFSTMLSIHDN